MRNGVHKYMGDPHEVVDMPHAIAMVEDLVDQEGLAKYRVHRVHSENVLGKEYPLTNY